MQTEQFIDYLLKFMETLDWEAWHAIAEVLGGFSESIFRSTEIVLLKRCCTWANNCNSNYDALFAQWIYNFPHQKGPEPIKCIHWRAWTPYTESRLQMFSVFCEKALALRALFSLRNLLVGGNNSKCVPLHLVEPVGSTSARSKAWGGSDSSCVTWRNPDTIPVDKLITPPSLTRIQCLEPRPAHVGVLALSQVVAEKMVLNYILRFLQIKEK